MKNLLGLLFPLIARKITKIIEVGEEGKKTEIKTPAISTEVTAQSISNLSVLTIAVADMTANGLPLHLTWMNIVLAFIGSIPLILQYFNYTKK